MKEQFNNSRFIEKIKPFKVILISFLVWCVIFFTAPLKINISINYEAYLYMFLCWVSFFLGGLFYRSSKKNLYNTKRIINENKMLIITISLASIGLTLKLIDRFLIRGISLGHDYFENRAIMESGGGSIQSLLASFLTPFGYIPLFIFWKYKPKLSLLFKIIIFSLFFLQTFDALLLGARSGVFITVVIFIIYILYFRKFQFNVKNTLLIILFSLSFMVYNSYVFIKRTELFAGENSKEIILTLSNFNFTCTGTPLFKKNIQNLSPLQQTIAFSYLTTAQYFTHGMLEFSYLYDRFYKEHVYGRYTFDVYDRFFKNFSFTKYNAQEVIELTPRPAVYNTLIGPLFIDFGWFNLIFMFFFGRFTYFVHHLAKSGIDWAIIFYFILFIMFAFWPVFCFINGAGGIFLITCTFIFSNIYNLASKTKGYEKIN